LKYSSVESKLQRKLLISNGSNSKTLSSIRIVWNSSTVFTVPSNRPIVTVAIIDLQIRTSFQGVESDRVPSFSRAMEHGRPVTVDARSTLADGLAVPRVGCNAFATAVNLVDKMVSGRGCRPFREIGETCVRNTFVSRVRTDRSPGAPFRPSTHTSFKREIFFPNKPTELTRDETKPCDPSALLYNSRTYGMVFARCRNWRLSDAHTGFFARRTRSRRICSGLSTVF